MVVNLRTKIMGALRAMAQSLPEGRFSVADVRKEIKGKYSSADILTEIRMVSNVIREGMWICMPLQNVVSVTILSSQEVTCVQCAVHIIAYVNIAEMAAQKDLHFGCVALCSDVCHIHWNTRKVLSGYTPDPSVPYGSSSMLGGVLVRDGTRLAWLRLDWVSPRTDG